MGQRWHVIGGLYSRDALEMLALPLRGMFVARNGGELSEML